MSKQRTSRFLATATLATVLTGSVLAGGTAPVAAAFSVGADLTVSGYCDGATPAVALTVTNTGSNRLLYAVGQDGVDVLDEQAVDIDGVEQEILPYPATGPGTSYTILSSDARELLTTAELTDPQPVCTEDDPDDPPATDPEPSISYEVGCEGPEQVVQVTLHNDGDDDWMPWLFFDLEVVQADVLIPAHDETTVYFAYPDGPVEHPYFELWTIDERRIAQTELTDPAPVCDDGLPGSDEPGSDEAAPGEPGHDLTVVVAVPATPLAATPAYTG